MEIEVTMYFKNAEPKLVICSKFDASWSANGINIVFDDGVEHCLCDRFEVK